MVAFVDHKDFEELACQILVLAQVIDEIAHGQMFGHGHEIAAHQAPCGFLRIGQRAFDCDPVFGLQFRQHRPLVGLVQILD